MKKYKVAVAGAGRAGEELAIGSFRKGAEFVDLSNAELVAIADVDEARLRMLKEKYRIPAIFTDVARMLDEAKPDVLIITSPLGEHHAHAMMAIERGVNFILEKPATETLAQLKELKAASERRKVKGMVTHNYKFMGGFQTAWSWYRKGYLGEIIHIDRHFLTPAHEDRMERADAWWHHIPGGRLADCLPHHLYVSYPFVGEMELKFVSVKKLSQDRPWSACDEADIVLSTPKAYVNIRMSTNQVEWPEGKHGTSYYNVLMGTRRNAFCFQDEAQIIMPGHTWKMRRAKDSLKEIYGSKVAGLFGKRPDRGIRGGHNLMYKHFLSYLEGGIECPVPWDEAIHVQKLTSEIGLAMQREIDLTIKKQPSLVPA